MNLKLFISDLDGTILETEDYHRLAYNALFNELGLKQTWSKQDYVARLQTMGGNKFREIFEWMKLPEDEYRETRVQLYQRKTELYVELITRDLGNGTLGLRPGIVRFFTEVMEAGFQLLSQPLVLAGRQKKWLKLPWVSNFFTLLPRFVAENRLRGISLPLIYIC